MINFHGLNLSSWQIENSIGHLSLYAMEAHTCVAVSVASFADRIPEEPIVAFEKILSPQQEKNIIRYSYEFSVLHSFSGTLFFSNILFFNSLKV